MSESVAGPYVMSTIDDQLHFFARNGYVVVPSALSPAEVRLINATIDEDLVDNKGLWSGAAGRNQNVNILLARPELDFTMRPPSILQLMEAIIGPELCAEEHSVMIRNANPAGPTECVWHRDSDVGGTEPPYYTRYLSVVFYLTDVDETTHTFSVIPGSAQTADPGELDEYDQSAAHHIEGKSGTAVLVNSYTFHAGNVRNTAVERRTIHIYCGRSSDEHLSNCTIFPPRLWEGNDEATRHYYNRLNPISELVLNRF